jgi:hypothetical protein
MKMKAYSLKWWFSFGKLDGQLGRKEFKHIVKRTAKIAYKIGYWAA